MNEKLFNELEERIQTTEADLRQVFRNVNYKKNLQNQLITLKILRELYNWRIEKESIDLDLPAEHTDTSALPGGESDKEKQSSES